MAPVHNLVLPVISEFHAHRIPIKHLGIIHSNSKMLSTDIREKPFNHNDITRTIDELETITIKHVFL